MLKYSNDLIRSALWLKSSICNTVANVVRGSFCLSVALIMRYISKSSLARGIKNVSDRARAVPLM